MLVLLVPVAAILLVHYFMTGFVVYNDGRGYYTWLRSAVIDRDVNFTNEWTYYNTTHSKFASGQRAESVSSLKTPKGYMVNIYLIGNAIMWAPFYLTAHAASLLLNAAGFAVRTDGYGFLYEMSVGIASLIYGFLGAWMIYKFCKKWFESKTAVLATIAVWYGTAFFWYHAAEPSMSHMNSIFLTALFTHLWYNTLGKRTKVQWLALGLLLGLIYLVRQQEVLLGLLPAFELIKRLAKKVNFDTIRKTAIASALLGIGIFIITLPQMLIWKRMYGSYLVYSYGDPETLKYWYWTMPQILPLFFSQAAGMWRVPIMLLSIIGLFLFAKRVKGVAWYFAAVVLAQVLIVSAWTGWPIGYGVRYLLGMSIFFALGAAQLIRMLRSRLSMKAICAIVFLLILANFINMLIVMLTEITSRIPLSEVLRLLTKTVL